jgi:hypothetical protein
MIRLFCLVALVGVLAVSPRAFASAEDDARVYLDKATAAYALNKYAVAAENFEKAFELKPDPALLYNAAQAYRLAGNKERALELYESYLRVYGKKASSREQVEQRIRDLKQAIAHDKSVSTSPPNNTLPVPVGRPTEPPPAAAAPVAPLPPAPVAPAPAPAPVAPVAAAPAPVAPLPAAPPPADHSADNPTMLTQSGAPKDDDSLLKKPMFWVAVGGGVVAAAVVVILLASGGSKSPSPSLGSVEGN